MPNLPFRPHNLDANEHSVFLRSQSRMETYQLPSLTITAPAGVYHPREGSSSLFFLKHLPSITKSRILELGTGSGIIALTLANPALGNKVWASDIDASAAKAATDNAKHNKLPVVIVESDLFQHPALKATPWDYILFNTPYFHKPQTEEFDHIGCDPSGSIFTRYIQQGRTFLKPTGSLIFTYSNLSNPMLFDHLMKQHHFDWTILGEEQDPTTNVMRWLIQATPA